MQETVGRSTNPHDNRRRRRPGMATITSLVAGTAMIAAAVTIAPHLGSRPTPHAEVDKAATISIANMAQDSDSTGSPIVGTVRANPYVTVRSGPGTEYPPSPSGNASTGTNFQVLCYATGAAPVTGWGGTNSEWDRVADPTNPSQSLGYVADVWLDTRDDAHTGGDITAEVSDCSTVDQQSSSSSGQQATQSTDGNALTAYWWGEELDLNAYWTNKLIGALNVTAGAAAVVAVLATAGLVSAPAALPAGVASGVLWIGAGAIQTCSDDKGVALYLTDVGVPWCAGR